MKKVGIVTPIANEEATIVAFITTVLKHLDPLPYDFSWYIIMDRFSKDKTFELVQLMAAKDARIKLIFYKDARGVISCHLEGFRNALAGGSDFIIEMDGGGSHPPEKIKEILHALDEEGFEFVSMSRFMPGGAMENMPFYRRVVSRGGTFLANMWLGTRFSDGTGAFHGYRANVLRALDFGAFLSVGGIYSTEMKYYVNEFKRKELPFTYVGSTSDFKAKWIWIALKVLYKMKWNKTRALSKTAT